MTLYIGGSVYIYGPPSWPSNVTLPLHYYPFSETGDYSDRGSTGGLTLVAQGTGNSFDANGLVLNGSGYAKCPTNNADLNNLGSTFSVLFDMQEFVNTANAIFISSYETSANYAPVVGNDDCIFYISSGGWKFVRSGIGTIPHANRNQIIVTYAAGILTFYLNGEYVTEGALDALTGSATEHFAVGATATGGQPMTGTYRRVGVLKGTAWTVTDVAAIYAELT